MTRLDAYSDGGPLGLLQTPPSEVKEKRYKLLKEETVTVDLLHRSVPAKYTYKGLCSVSGESPIRPESMQKVLGGKFGDALEDLSKGMTGIAKAFPPSQLVAKGYTL